MVNNIVTYLNAKLELLDYFERSFCLCELITEGDETFPAQYSGKGEYENINLDNDNGVSYWRKNGDVASEEIDNLIGCEEFLQISIPLKLVIAIPKTKLSRDDAYAADLIARTIIKQIEENVKDLRTLIQARKIIVHVDSYTTDNNQIVSDEYSAERAINFKLAYLAMDVEVTVEITKRCFLTECDDKDDDLLHMFDFCDQAVINRLTAAQLVCINSEICAISTPVIVTDAENPASPVSVVCGGTYSCFPCTPPDQLLCSDVNDNVTGLTQVVRNQVQRVNPVKTGQTTSFAVGDDGDLEKGRGVDFFTLDCNNEFGNTDRFTDSVGGQNYDGTGGSIVDYVIDHLTGMGWDRNLRGTNIWTAALTAANGSAFGGFADWRLPNKQELDILVNDELLRSLNYAPFSLGGGGASVVLLWVSTTVSNTTTRARLLAINHTVPQVIGRMTESLKTSGFNFIIARNHY